MNTDERDFELAMAQSMLDAGMNSAPEPNFGPSVAPDEMGMGMDPEFALAIKMSMLEITTTFNLNIILIDGKTISHGFAANSKV